MVYYVERKDENYLSNIRKTQFILFYYIILRSRLKLTLEIWIVKDESNL